MTLLDIQATVTIGGNSMSGHIVSVEREHSLEHIGQTFSVVLDASTAQNIDPWDDVVITENGVLVLTGYVDSITVERAPNQIIVTGMDTWKRALDTFLDGNLVTSNETVGHWIDYLCAAAGISQTSPSLGRGLLVGEGVPLGLRPVSDALFTISVRALWNIRVLADGVVEFISLSLGTPDHDLTAFEHGEYEVADRDTRNVVKVWGWDDEPESPGGSMLDIETRSVPGIDQDRIMVFANPMIDTAAEAQEMATAALDHFANLDKYSRVDLPGDPTYFVGNVGYAEVLSGSPHTQFITDLRMTTSDQGYAANITLGRKNFLLPFFEGTPIDEPVEEGEPDPVWEFESVPGIAKDTYVFGTHVYTVGTNNSGSSGIGWIEKRLVSDGTLVWDEAISGTESLHGIWVDAAGVYIYGISSADEYVLAGLDDSDASENWRNIENVGGQALAGSHLRGDVNGLYMLGGIKGFPGADATALAQKRSRADGSLVWQSSGSLPVPSFPTLEFRLFFSGVDATVDISDDVVLVGGATSQPRATNSATASQNFNMRIAYDKSTGSILWHYLEHTNAGNTNLLGRMFDVAVDRFQNGNYWGQGFRNSPTAGQQRLNKFSNSANLASFDGPDTSVSSTAMRSEPGMLFHYDLWSKSGVYNLRATSKGTLVTIWTEIMGHITLGLHFWEFGPSIFHCGQRNGNFFTARWNV